MKYCRLNGIDYNPITPCADTDLLASTGQRLILYHGNPSQIKIAPKDVLTAGWVIGVDVWGPFKEEN